MNFVIYALVNKVDGKRYVGCTMGLRSRVQQHQAKARLGSKHPLHRAMREHGFDAFGVEAVEMVDTVKAARVFERAAIAVFDAKTPSGYNIYDGGGGSRPSKLSEKLVPKIRKARLMGWTWRQIAWRLGVDQESVKSLLRRTGDVRGMRRTRNTWLQRIRPSAAKNVSKPLKRKVEK